MPAKIHNLWLGIDPGLFGAVAVIEGVEIEIHDTPILSNGKRNIIDAARCAELLRDIKDDCDGASRKPEDGEYTKRRLMVTIEKSQPMPKNGCIASFSLGYSFGVWIGILTALEIPYQLATPQAWKKALMPGEPKEKDASRIVARRLWPSQTEEYLSRKKDHGRADALLMAEHGRRKSGVLDE